MTKTSVGTGLAALVAMGAAFYAQNRANSALRREMAELRAEVRRALAAVERSPTASGRELAALPAVVERIDAGETASAAGMRAAMASLPPSAAESTPMAEAAPSAPPARPSNEIAEGERILAGELKNVGQGTPEATIETALWAAVGGNLEVLADVVMFSPEIKAKADGWFAGLPESTRREHGTPEKAIAATLARDAAELKGMQLQGRTEVAADEVGVRVLLATGAGKTKEETFLTQRAAGGWKMVLPDELVEKLARKFSDG